jgi:hypothetical protein
LWAEDIKGFEIETECWENALTRWSYCEWTDAFKKICTSATDSENSGHPSVARSEGKQKQDRAMVLKDRNIAIRDI